MNENRSPRKEIIKNITIIFLAILLILTFFSNTILNYSLPQVSATYVNQGTISEQIRGSGTVEAAESYEVIFEQSRKVKSVAVKSGQTISKDDILFELEDKESEELETAQKTLDELELNYKKAMIDFAEKSGYESEYFEISKTEQELAKLETQLENVQNGNDPLSNASEEYRKAKEESDKLTREKDKLTAALASVDTDDMLDLTGSLYEKLSKAKDTVKKYETKAEKKQTAYDNLVKEVGEISDYAAEIKSLRDQIETERASLNSYYDKLYSADAADDTSDIYASISASHTKINQLQRDMSELTVKSATSSLKKTELKNAQNDLTKAQDDLTDAKNNLVNVTKEVKLELKNQINAVSEKIDAANRKMQTAENNKNDAEASGLLSKAQLTAKISETEDKLSELRAQLTLKQSTDSAQNEKDQLDLEAQAAAIEKQKTLIEKLKGESFDTVVKAPVGGTIQSVSVTAGGSTPQGSACVVINVSDMGYVIEFPVKLDQAKKVKVGDKAEITSWYWGEDFSAELKEIRTDTANPQTQKILSFKVTGTDISTGQTLTLSMGSKGQPYSTVVPNSAVREDSNGKFVLVMEAKSSPLGNRYKAVRYDIEVLAKDDNNTAVSGLLGSEFVITASTTPINAGDQVRPSE